MTQSGGDKVLARGKFLQLAVRDGWEFAERPGIAGIVLILAITDEGRLILTEQYREPVRSPCIELPAGLVGDQPGHQDEALADAARRELLEETGYEAHEIAVLTEGPPSPGMTTEIVTLVRARGLRKVAAGGGDESEAIVVHEVPLAEAESWLSAKARAGVMVDPKVYAGLYFARNG